MSKTVDIHNWNPRSKLCEALDISLRTLQRRVNCGAIEKTRTDRRGLFYLYRVPRTVSQVQTPEILHIKPMPNMQTPSDKAGLTKAYTSRITKFVADINSYLTNHSPVKQGPGNIPAPGSSLCIMISDVHMGKKTNTTNSKTIHNAILSISDQIVEQALPEDLNEIVLILGGDMVDGEDIYGHQAHHLEDSVIDQVVKVADAIAKLTKQLDFTYGEDGVHIRIETVPGNHGRMSKTANPKSNWDNVVYIFLATALAQYENISVNANTNTFNCFKVQDKTGLVTHKGPLHLGTAAQSSKIAGWFKLYNNPDFVCYGHWHKWDVNTVYGVPVIKNGAIIGRDDLSESMGVYDPPRQAWWIVTNGETISKFGFYEFGER